MTLSDNLVRINLLRKGLDEIRPLNKQAQDKLWEKLRLEWNYNSNHIEGNTLTYSETKLLLIFEKTTGDHEKREYDEMQAHDVAIHLVRDLAADDERGLTLADIKNLNKIILVKPYWKEALTYDGQPTRRQIKVGDYKEHPNSVRLKSGEMFHYASPEETPRLMQELIDWYRTNDIQHPLMLAAELHYRFIRIHPFDDGNGRVARLLVNYVLMKHGYTPIIIKSADKENYITALQKSDAGDEAAFPNYMAKQLVWSMEMEEKAAMGESIEEPDDLDKELSLLRKKLKGEDVLKTAASADIICDAMETNIIPLFMMIEEKCKTLKEFFFETNRRINYQTTQENGERSVGSDESTWENIKQNWLNKHIRAEVVKLRNVKYSYELRGFKKTVSAHSFWASAEVYFSEYNYSIQNNTNRNNPVLIPYGKELSFDELQNFITPIIKEIIEGIKRQNDNN